METNGTAKKANGEKAPARFSAIGSRANRRYKIEFEDSEFVVVQTLKEALKIFVPEVKYDGFGPSFLGSPRCESNSLASGGTRSYCTCDTCF